MTYREHLNCYTKEQLIGFLVAMKQEKTNEKVQFMLNAR